MSTDVRMNIYDNCEVVTIYLPVYSRKFQDRWFRIFRLRLRQCSADTYTHTCIQSIPVGEVDRNNNYPSAFFFRATFVSYVFYYILVMRPCLSALNEVLIY